MKKTAKISLIVAIFVAILISVLLVNIVYAKPNNPNKGHKECNDGIDNDGDGLIDLSDPGCSSRGDKSELGTNQCDDGIDNDGDGLIDLNDPGCTSVTDNDETDPIIPQCNDGIDNDGDGHIDVDDSECISLLDNDESPRDFCNDSDGFNLFRIGLVSGEDDSVSFNNTDFCLNNFTIREYVCGSKSSDYDLRSIDVNCLETGNATACNLGACI